MQIIRETDEFTDYALSNPDLKVSSPYTERARNETGKPAYKILDQRLVRVNRASFGKKTAEIQQISSDKEPLLSLSNPGVFRGKNVQLLTINATRYQKGNPSTLLILKQLKIRVYKPELSRTARSMSRNKVQPQQRVQSELASGTWYKIPITRSAIYSLDRSYLSDMGIDVDAIQPQNIQIWTTPGYELVQENSVDHPELSQIPIQVTGSSDNSFDGNDRVIFYANSPHETYWDSNTGRFRHRLHHYSDSNYVFLTVGSQQGKRFSPYNAPQSPSQTITDFTDFHWKEEELRKPEDNLKSGLKWVGQEFGTNVSEQTQLVFTDTLPGVSGTVPMDIRTRFVARSTLPTQFRLSANDNIFARLDMAKITTYTGSENNAAKSYLHDGTINYAVSSNIISLRATYTYTEPGSRGWLDWIEVSFPRSLVADNGRLKFYTPEDGSADEFARYQLTGFDETPIILDVTNPVDPVWIPVSSSGSNHSVTYHTETGRQLIAQSAYNKPHSGRPMSNQNISDVQIYPDYIVITGKELLDQARDLADYRSQHDQFASVVVTQQQIFNEYSGGVPDIMAIRNYVRYLYNRALGDNRTPPRYLMLFGDTNYDYKQIISNPGMRNFVFTYQSPETYDRVGTYGTDDFYGLLDTTDGNWSSFNTPYIDIGIGRLPVQSQRQAEDLIEKIKRYESPETYGNWRTRATFVADDHAPGGDEDLHILNANGTISRIDKNATGIEVNKIYTLNYPSVNTSSGRRYPEATQDFIDAFNNGSLIVNYSGHGAEQVLSDERLFISDYISRLNNKNKPSILVTATCSFGRFDDVAEQSGAEKLVLWDNGGSVAALTTTRVVLTNSSTSGDNNYSLNIELTKEMFRRTSDGFPQRLGDIYLNTKSLGKFNSENSRKFVLLGDPAMRFGLPKQKVKTTGINNQNTENSSDTLNLQALDKVQVEGHLTNSSDQRLSNFNGTVNLKIFGAERFISYPQDLDWVAEGNYRADTSGYYVERDILFNGRASVQNGRFTSEFIIPKDINSSTRTGRFMMYARQNGENMDASGSFNRVTFNGVNDNAPEDNTGPELDVYLNTDTFVNGSLVSDSPVLKVDLSDSSGINTTGNGVGHELIAEINTSPKTVLELNEHYKSNLDDFSSGTVEYPIENLPEGSYELTVRAWDIYNNPTEETISFEVASGQNLVVDNIYNYPNPMSSETDFIFEHNQPGNPLEVTIRIYTLSGRPVKEIRQQVVTPGSYARINWQGRDQNHRRLANGTYIYVVKVKATTPEGTQTREKIEKLVILQ